MKVSTLESNERKEERGVVLEEALGRRFKRLKHSLTRAIRFCSSKTFLNQTYATLPLSIKRKKLNDTPLLET